METSDDTVRENSQKNTVGSTLKSLWRNRTKIGGTLLFLAMTGPYGFAALIAFYALKNTVKGLLKMKLEYDLKTATEQAKHRQNEIRRAYQGGGEVQTAAPWIEGQEETHDTMINPDLPLPVEEPVVVPEAGVALPLEAVGPALSVREPQPGEQSEQTTTPLNSEQSEAQGRAINTDPHLPGSEVRPAMESGPTMDPQEQSLVSEENKEASTDKTEVTIEDIQRQFDASPNNLERLRHSDLRALVVVQPTALAIQNKHDSNTTISLKPTTMVPRDNNRSRLRPT